MWICPKKAADTLTLNGNPIHMRRISLIILAILLYREGSAQKIAYSEPEKEDFNRFRFDVIAHRNDRILVYKAVYSGDPNSSHQYQGPAASYANPSTIAASSPSILESTICIYDPSMKLQEKILLPLPKQIAGVHFLVYGDFFYLFYQYQHAHTIYCMAAKIGMDGKLIGSPLEMDHTDVIDVHYQSQIYSVIYSDDKKRILIFNEDGHLERRNIINSLLFDQDLHLLRKSAHSLSMEGSEYLSEYKVDNEGNFIFLGRSGSMTARSAHRGILFTLGAEDDSLTYHYYVSPDLFIDEPQLLIDNNHKKYIVVSFYSKAVRGDMEGLFCVIWDVKGGYESSATKTILSDSLRRQIKPRGSIKTVFNDFYLQDLHLRKDGGFGVETEDLVLSPDHLIYDRWSYLGYLSEQVATNFIFYDPYDHNLHYPWKTSKFGGLGFAFHGESSMIFSFNPDGVVEWINTLNTPQIDRFHSTIGYKSFVVDDLIYFLYNVTIRRKNFLTAQSINSAGQTNTDPRVKEDAQFKDIDRDYIYFPRLAKVVGAGELIMPCQKGGMISLVRLEF
jgi:hypothetical protein